MTEVQHIVEQTAISKGITSMSAKAVRPTNWERLLERLSFYSNDASERWIFRGVTDVENHRLIPKVGRCGARKDTAGDSLPYCALEERRMVEEFSRKAKPYFSHHPGGLLEVMAIAQHHGMATRLLDWTESLFVAAYFGAVYAGADNRQGGVYAVKSSGFPVLKGTEDPFSLCHDVALYWPPHIAARIPAQRSLFTVHQQPDAVAFQPSHMEVLAFPRGSETFRIKRMLDECGINEASLFPDIVGLAKYLGWRYKWGRLDPT